MMRPTACSGGRIVSWIIYCWLVWCERKILFWQDMNSAPLSGLASPSQPNKPAKQALEQ